jgi:hypothetical protein
MARSDYLAGGPFLIFIRAKARPFHGVPVQELLYYEKLMGFKLIFFYI